MVLRIAVPTDFGMKPVSVLTKKSDIATCYPLCKLRMYTAHSFLPFKFFKRKDAGKHFLVCSLY